MRRSKRAANGVRSLAKLFWWFNQGAEVDVSVTPKPHYGADGNKAFDILSYPRIGAERDRQEEAGAVSVREFLGPDGGLALHAMDRPLCRGSVADVPLGRRS